jgi:hypothetical protein
MPSVDVATQRVEVPTDWRIIPRVPEALIPSRKVPRRLKLVVVLVKTLSLVVDAVPKYPIDEVIPVVDALVRLARVA